MRLVVFVSSGLALLAASPAIAQSADMPHRPTLSIGNPGFAAPGTQEQAPGVPAPHQPNVPDQVFVIEAALGGAAQIELAQLAEQKTRNDRVREFARQMIRDRSQAGDTLDKLAEGNGISIPEQLDAEHRQVRDALRSLTGPEFDIEYLRTQMQDNQRMVQLFEYEIGSGADPQIQRFASRSLPNIFAQLATSRDLLEQVSRQNPQLAAAPPSKISGMPTLQTPRSPSN